MLMRGHFLEDFFKTALNHILGLPLVNPGFQHVLTPRGAHVRGA